MKAITLIVGLTMIGFAAAAPVGTNGGRFTHHSPAAEGAHLVVVAKSDKDADEKIGNLWGRADLDESDAARALAAESPKDADEKIGNLWN